MMVSLRFRLNSGVSKVLVTGLCRVNHLGMLVLGFRAQDERVFNEHSISRLLFDVCIQYIYI